MPEQLLDLLQLCLLVLLYLFFVGVLRVVWVEVDGPRRAGRRAAAAVPVPAEPMRRRSGGAQRAATIASTATGALVVVAPDGAAGEVHRLVGEVVVGRAPGCTVVLEDGFASQRHARFLLRDGVAYVEDLRSTNGTLLDGRPVQGEAPLAPGSRVQIGSTVLEYRS